MTQESVKHSASPVRIDDDHSHFIRNATRTRVTSCRLTDLVHSGRDASKTSRQLKSVAVSFGSAKMCGDEVRFASICPWRDAHKTNHCGIDLVDHRDDQRGIYLTTINTALSALAASLEVPCRGTPAMANAASPPMSRQARVDPSRPYRCRHDRESPIMKRNHMMATSSTRS